MKTWPKHPVIYEINTWVWLNELSQKYTRKVDLGSVPEKEWDNIASYNFDAVWFMGVWERSPAGIDISMKNTGLLEDFRRALPDFSPEDNVGSPYCIRNYIVDEHLGGPKGLLSARKNLANRGILLMLDFVPNHVAPDHPWVSDHPEYFIQGNDYDLQNDRSSYIQTGGKVFACGRDPYFPAWPDVLQLNAFQPGLRKAVIKTVSEIAGQCDGIRCDMAMLLMNNIFERTWENYSGKRPETEYWVDLISSVKKTHPEFLFMAEAYWDLEWELQQLGFDYCYDKRLYDRLEKDNADNIYFHLCADLRYQEKLVRFIENHDEPRALSVFSIQKECAAAITIATIPGAKIFHEGQFEGRKIRLPVFLGRRPDENQEPDLDPFYRKLINAASLKRMHKGTWQLCERTGWPGNEIYPNLVAWCWRMAGERILIVVNLSDIRVQGRIRLPWYELKGNRWLITDLFSNEKYERNGDEMCYPGLYVDLPPWGFHVFNHWIPVN
jgi:glycosidase